MLNRVQDKELAKQYLAENGNQSGMTGMEILYGVIKTVTLLSLTAVLAASIAYPLGLGMLGGLLHWFFAALMNVIVVLFIGLVNEMLRAPFEEGRCRYYLRTKKERVRPSATSIFESYDFFVQFAIVAVLKEFTILWLPTLIFAGGFLLFIILGLSRSPAIVVIASLLLLFAVIAGIIVEYYNKFKYWAVPWIHADHPQMNAKEILELSQQMTSGHIWDLIVFELSFWGWHFLSKVTGGLVGLLYSTPYYNLSRAIVYEELKGRPIALDGIDTSKSARGYTIGITPKTIFEGGKPPISKSSIGGARPASPVNTPHPVCEAKLEGISGMYAGSSFPLTPDKPVILGRDGAVAQIVFTQGAEKISRRHCEVVFDSRMSKYRVTDFSSNGTYVGTNRLPQNSTVVLERGASIALGNNNNIIRLV